jgi:hypothetical protein
MKRRFALLAAIVVITACGLSAQTLAKTEQIPAKTDPWAGLRFLLGSWEAKTTGGVAQAQASGVYAFQLELRDHVLARHSTSGACKGPEDFNCQHGDLLYIYPVGNGEALKAIYFDNEGHVIPYEVSTPKPGTVIFLSDSAQPGPQFRLSYQLAEGVMTGKFQLKMPGQKEFTSYLEWSGTRQ